MSLVNVHVHVHVHLLPAKHPPQCSRFQTRPFLIYDNPPKFHHRISCSGSNSNSIHDLELSMEIEKMKTQMVQTREAMKNSTKVLYAELCLYHGLGEEEMKRKWERMEEDDKRFLTQQFVSEWGSDFHPLSARSVKELVDQHLLDVGADNDNSSQDPSPSILIQSLKKIMGFPRSKGWSF